MKLRKFTGLILVVLTISVFTVCSTRSDDISPDEITRLKNYLKITYATQLPLDAQIDVTGYEKSEIKGLKRGNFKLTVSGKTIDIPFFIEDSGRYIVLGEPVNMNNFEETPIKGIKKGSLTISNRAFPILVTDDSKYIIAGEVIDTTVDKTKELMDKISLNDVPTKGNKSAKVTIVEYSDFQCPFCSRANPILTQVLKDYKDKVKVVYKQYPLPNHNWAKPASIASLCSYKEGGHDKFWEFHDKLFENQRIINIGNSQDKFKEFAKELGLDETKFGECLNDQAVLAKVDQEMAEAVSIGVNSTPTFVVNGIVVRGANPNGLKSAIELSLN